jgi:hypothetical protein
LAQVTVFSDWRFDPNEPASKLYAKVRIKSFLTHRQILKWFADSPNAESPYSIHNMLAAGAIYDKV